MRAKTFNEFIRVNEADAIEAPGLVTKIINFEYDFSDVNKELLVEIKEELDITDSILTELRNKGSELLRGDYPGLCEIFE